jgi:DNA gyrase subunit A
MTNICTLEDTNIKDFDYYRTKNIPAVGYYLREEDEEDTQLKLLE